MMPVSISSMPHNYRGPLYRPGEAPDVFCEDIDYARIPNLGEFATLPIPMPHCLMITTDAKGRVIAAEADGKRIRWKDLDTVVKGVEQYNADCVRARSP